MTQSHDVSLSPQTVLDAMTKNGVTHVVWLPDSETNWLYLLMKAEPSTGLMESGNSLRGWGIDLNVPVVLMVGYRGWTRHGINKDTAAIYTERFLNAFGINYYLIENNADAQRISIAFEEARRTKRPVAVLVGDEYHGFNR